MQLEKGSREFMQLNEIFQDVIELSECITAEIQEMNNEDRVIVSDSTNIIDLFNHFDTSSNNLLRIATKRQEMQASLEGLNIQKEMLASYIK